MRENGMSTDDREWECLGALVVVLCVLTCRNPILSVGTPTFPKDLDWKDPTPRTLLATSLARWSIPARNQLLELREWVRRVLRAEQMKKMLLGEETKRRLPLVQEQEE